MYIRLIIAVFIVAVFSACAAAGQAPQTTAVPPIAPAQTDGPAAAPDRPTQSIGTPVPGWENIPVMPGAYNGELEDLVYLYSVEEPVEKVEEFYLTKMDVNGWELSNRQVMESGSSSGPATILEFRKNDLLLNIMLVHVPDESATAVLLTQFGP